MIAWFDKIKSDVYDFDIGKKICLFVVVFLVGSLVGFLYEEVFYLIFENVLEKRGFLYGPYLPVYGFGAVLMALFLKRFKKNPLLVFVLAMLVAGVLEYFTGYVLWQLYHKMWWDYTGLFLNIDGYVCLRSVLSFGVGGLFLIYVVEPLLSSFVYKMDNYKIYIVSYITCIVFLFDLFFTLLFRNRM